MTTVREVTDIESEKLWFEGTFRDRPDVEQLHTMWMGYLDQGHLVTFCHAEGDHPGQSWFAKCSCGANVWSMSSDEMRAIAEAGGSDLARPMPSLLNFGQVRFWSRDHRVEHGLEKQDFAPTVDLNRFRSPA